MCLLGQKLTNLRSKFINGLFRRDIESVLKVLVRG